MHNNLKIPTFLFHEVRLDLVLGEQEGLVKMEREKKGIPERRNRENSRTEAKENEAPYMVKKAYEGEGH